jgi:hypothetical protein
MSAHNHAMLEQMLSAAENHVAKGAERIRVQEARVAALKHKETRVAEQTKQLLAIMLQTQELHIGHVALLKRELASSPRSAWGQCHEAGKSALNASR